VSEHLCATCSRLIADGATVCITCKDDITAALKDIAAYRGLGWDLDVAMTRRTHVRLTPGEVIEEKHYPGVLPATPLPYNPRAADTARTLRNVLATWARLICQETGADQPADTITAIAAWMVPWVGWLRHHPAGDEAHKNILDAVWRARRIVDRPPERLYAGVCICGAHLYARTGDPVIVCRAGEHDEPLVFQVEERRAEMLTALDDYLANSRQMARLMGYLGITLPDSTIRWWASEKGKRRILAHGTDKDGRPLYRLGEVVRCYAKTSAKAG
jgi:hypothetical protein